MSNKHAPHGIKNLDSKISDISASQRQPSLIASTPYDIMGRITGGNVADGWTVVALKEDGNSGKTYSNIRSFPPGESFAIDDYVFLYFANPNVLPLVRGAQGSGSGDGEYILTDNITYFSS